MIQLVLTLLVLCGGAMLFDMYVMTLNPLMKKIVAWMIVVAVGIFLLQIIFWIWNIPLFITNG